jgi:hypothetical protein
MNTANSMTPPSTTPPATEMTAKLGISYPRHRRTPDPGPTPASTTTPATSSATTLAATRPPLATWGSASWTSTLANRGRAWLGTRRSSSPRLKTAAAAALTAPLPCACHPVPVGVPLGSDLLAAACLPWGLMVMRQAARLAVPGGPVFVAA